MMDEHFGVIRDNEVITVEELHWRLMELRKQPSKRKRPFGLTKPEDKKRGDFESLDPRRMREWVKKEVQHCSPIEGLYLVSGKQFREAVEAWAQRGTSNQTEDSEA